MNNSITQANQNDKQIPKSVKRFFTRFHISSALKAANAYKKKGIPAVEVFQYLFLLVFSNRSMYMSLITGRDTPDFAKDTVYRFMKMVQINWIRFTTLLASRIIRGAIAPLDSEKRTKVLIIDDSMFERNRSKKVELLANTDTVLASACSHWDGQMAVLSCRLTVSFSHRRRKRTGSMRPWTPISEPQGTGAGCFPRKKAPR